MSNFFSSLKLFYALCAGLAAAFVWQTLFNKGPSVYASPWFTALGLLLTFNIAACAAKRAGKAPLYYILIHAGLVLVLLGAFTTRAFRFEGSLPLKKGADASLAGEGKYLYRLPFSVRLEEFSISYYKEPSVSIEADLEGKKVSVSAVPGAVLALPEAGTAIRVLEVLNDFGLGHDGKARNKSPHWNNPAARLELTSKKGKESVWIFSNFPGMHGEKYPFGLALQPENSDIRGFTSLVTVKPAQGEPFKAEISVNKPLKTGGYTLYQSSYDPADPDYSLLTATRDRGAWIVYAGFAALLAGMLLWLRK